MHEWEMLALGSMMLGLTDYSLAGKPYDLI